MKKIEFIESYRIPDDGGDYQWDDNHGRLIRCKDCKWWRQQINYQGNPLSFNPLPFGCCESDDMWRSLYGETCEVSHIDTDEDFYCGYAELRGEQE